MRNTALALVLAATLSWSATAQADEPKTEPAVHRPVLSPTGNQIAYMVLVNEDWELFLSNADGSDPRRLTDHAGWDGYATWAPDGKSLVFDHGEAGSKMKQPYVIALDDQATSMFHEYQGWVSVSDWLADGSMIGSHEREPDIPRDLVRIDGTTGELKYITETPDRSEGDAVVSPDGKTIFFFERINEKSNLAKIDIATGKRENIYAAHDRGYGTAISPDGQNIAFVDVQPGEENSDIFVLSLESGEVRRLTTDPSWDHMPIWTGDGSAIIFTSYRSGVERPYLVTLSGAETYPLKLP